MSKSVVSQIRTASKSVPSLQKWLLEHSQEATWECLTNSAVEAIYCIYRNGKCIYIGETGNVLRRISGHGVYQKGDVVYYISLPNSLKEERVNVEAELANKLKPSIGAVRGQIRPVSSLKMLCCFSCRHEWILRYLNLPHKCPKCFSVNWNRRPKS